jgi:hypothetical protein
MEYLEAKLDGTIGTIIIDHLERRNALSRQLVDALVETLDRFAHNNAREVPNVDITGLDAAQLVERSRVRRLGRRSCLSLNWRIYGLNNLLVTTGKEVPSQGTECKQREST